jgi:hypothetical protein
MHATCITHLIALAICGQGHKFEARLSVLLLTPHIHKTAEVLRMALTQELVSIEKVRQVDVSFGRLYDSLGVPQDQMFVSSCPLQTPVIRVRHVVVDWMNTKHPLLLRVQIGPRLRHGKACDGSDVPGAVSLRHSLPIERG